MDRMEQRLNQLRPQETDLRFVSLDELDALILEYEGKVYAIFGEYEGKSENFKNIVSFES